MNQKKEQDYWSAAASSFKWLSRTRTNRIRRDAVTRMSSGGFQPLSTTAMGPMLLMSDYFGPAECLNRISFEGDRLKFEVTWLHGAWNGVLRCRGGFPDMLYPTGANRCCVVFFTPDGKSVCIARGERELFVLSLRDDGQWKVAARLFLPGTPEYPSVHSASLVGNRLLTVESDATMKNWRTVSYSWNGEGDWGTNPPVFNEEGAQTSPQFHFGITFLRGKPVLVTGSHAVRGEDAVLPGIYIGGKLVVPGIVATGVALLQNGDLFLTLYGQEEEPKDTDEETGAGAHKGMPGQFIHVPSELLVGV